MLTSLCNFNPFEPGAQNLDVAILVALYYVFSIDIKKTVTILNLKTTDFYSRKNCSTMFVCVIVTFSCIEVRRCILVKEVIIKNFSSFVGSSFSVYMAILE